MNSTTDISRAYSCYTKKCHEKKKFFNINTKIKYRDSSRRPLKEKLQGWSIPTSFFVPFIGYESPPPSLLFNF